MPFKYSTNSKILPANARAADVAEKAIKEIIPVQQRRAYDAFRPQGITCIHYNHLTNGRKCNCQSGQKQINGLLDKDGKADIGTINEFITGGMSFDVTPYNRNQSRAIPEAAGANGWTSPNAPVNKHQGVFDIVANEGDFPFADIVEGPAVGDNGPINNIDIDDLVGDFDASNMGFSEVSCGICFGTGFIGGYSPYHAHRQVLTVADLSIVGELDLLQRPWRATATSFSQKIILPRGAIAIDVFRVWNNVKPVNAQFTIDGSPITNVVQILNKCDGLPHVIGATLNSEFTHLEMQFSLTTESVYFEFPKRPSSADTSLLEQMEPFQIILSPNLPTIGSMDIIVESQLGKVLVVQNVNPWESRQRNTLGWEAQVRVIQPQEIYRILPLRGRVMNKDASTKMVRDNQLGIYRT